MIGFERPFFLAEWEKCGLQHSMAMMPVRLDRRSLACAEQAWLEGDTALQKTILWEVISLCLKTNVIFKRHSVIFT